MCQPPDSLWALRPSWAPAWRIKRSSEPVGAIQMLPSRTSLVASLSTPAPSCPFHPVSVTHLRPDDVSLSPLVFTSLCGPCPVSQGGMGTRAQGTVSLQWLYLILGCPKAIFNSKDTAGALLTKPQGTPFEGKQTVLLQCW